MAITYGAGPGTHVTSFVVNETLGDQSEQSGNNTVVMTNTLATLSNGQHGTKYPTYVGRLIVIDLAGTQQRRMVISQAAGTGTRVILTVNEDWDTIPAQTTNTIHVAYDVDDIETGGAGGGINLNSRTGLYELTNDLTIDSGGGLQNSFGQALEADDAGTSPSIFISSGGYFFSGYISSNTPINGGIFTSYNNSAGEPNWQIASGGTAFFNDAVLWAQLYPQQFECAAGSDVTFNGSKLVANTQELHLFGATLIDSGISGRKDTAEIVRLNANSSVNGLVLSNIYALDSTADTATATIEAEGVIFSGVTAILNVRQNKTWNLIDPIWTVTTYTDLTWISSTGNQVNDRKSIKVTVQKADGTKLQDALVNVYENTQTADLVLELVTAATTGYAEGSFIYKSHITNSSTTTYGGHALQCGKWLYKPFVATQASTDKFNGVIVLSVDNNIVQTTQATAISNGSGITWNEDTNPSELFDFSSGSGTLADGMIITFSPSGAVGTITDSLDGDSISGTLHLKDRNATAIANGDTFSRTGGTAGTFSGTYDNDTKQPFAIWVDGNSLSYQTIYDYIAALTTETTLSATGELIWEWCRSAQTQALYATGSSFYTEQSNSKGIIIVNTGAGTADYFTDDSGTTWTPPTTTTVTFDKMKDNSEVRVYLTGTSTQIAGIEDAVDGSTDNRNFAWSAAATTVVDYVIHNFESGVRVYQSIRVNGYTVPAANVTINIQQILDRNVT